ncbi:hypothetical protein [Modestobacter marinus]|uniref:hypothetical protein n=1 Tax=Modestobacter marinus TaxID=477641 RepID=UPI001C98D5A2|nr:hypothetical protein [Modestobacter marinus]
MTRWLTRELSQHGVGVRLPQAPFGPAVPVPLRLGRKAVAVGLAGVADPRGAGRVLRAIVRSGQSGPVDLAARAVQWLVAQHVTARAVSRSGVSLVDEGVVQALWSVGLRGDVEPVLAAVDTRRLAPPADLLVVAHVSPELALERLTARRSQHSRTQSLTTTEMSDELRRGVRLLDRLVDWWATGPGGPHEVFVVRGTEETSDDRDRLLQHVLAAASAGSHPPA